MARESVAINPFIPAHMCAIAVATYVSVDGRIKSE